MTSKQKRQGPAPVISDSGYEVLPVYRQSELPPTLEDPGAFPYTRGIYPTMYRGRRWTMRQYSGFGTAEESNQRYRLLLERGQTGLSVAFDLPTQLGMDSDDERAVGEVGRVGVPVSTLDDMRRLFDGIDQAVVTTSMTINAPAAMLLLMYQIVAEERGVDPAALGGTIQNDILKEYAARGTYIFPPRPSMRLVVDTFAWCSEHLPNWNSISVSGYHMREAGASAAQEIGFTLANARAYVRAALEAGMAIDDFAPRISFFFAAHSNLLEEVAKFRAARRMWARMMRDEFSARDPKSWMLRFHTQTGGVTLTAQQPLNNVVRTSLQALSAVLGGTQSLHTNGYDEALALPTEEAATIALRTQQIISLESGVADTADPLAGSYYVEAMTDELEQRANDWITGVDDLGGAVAAIETGYVQNAIAENAYRRALSIDTGETSIVGVNAFVDDHDPTVPILSIDQTRVDRQIERVRSYKAEQNRERVEQALNTLHVVATGDENLLPAIKSAFEAGSTLGQVGDTLRRVFGEHRVRT